MTSPITTVNVHTVPEAAKVLRVSKSKLYQLCADGAVPHRKIDGTRIVLTDDDLRQILADAHRPAVA